MGTDFRKTALMAFLKDKEPLLWGKVVELRNEVENWLSYIPQTFPHYTRHTVQHSDAILVQLSKLLFRDESHDCPVVGLSSIEAYILVAAAYLHDAGMVTSDQEKRETLQSEQWRTWTTNAEPGAKRWAEIVTFRGGAIPSDSGVRNFLADVQTRFLIAEFIRRTHHLRAREFMVQHENQLGRFAMGDPVLLRAIADVCVAHGLRQNEIEDRDRYPERSDIQDQQVNLRFLAILLRLGDLLDLSTDRACPLLMNASCPLPSESLAHWTQYQRITHRLTSPDRIEITAQCQNQEEHRYLKDWCQWLVNEVQNAAVVMTRSTRHQDWHAPLATIDSSDQTIRIEPALDAKYIPSSWRFELDPEQVFQRLITDVYTEPDSFIRELIQNALDATRCQMYLDLQQEGLEPPESPTQLPEDRRLRYPVEISLNLRELINPLSGEKESRYVLTVEDLGIGMDRNIIERYLLQVGRSYYATHDFQKSFRFVPTSRFGVGFLSVFGASDHISIETYKPSSSFGDGPLKLVLTGPRNYLLLEKGHRNRSGTRIEVLLRNPLSHSQLRETISKWCRRVEFPIRIKGEGSEVTVNSERKEQFIYDIPDVTQRGRRFAVRAFDIQRPGIEGELYVFTRLSAKGEHWDAVSFAMDRYAERDPRASQLPFPEPLVCVHGIRVAGGSASPPASARIDFRGAAIPAMAMSREYALGYGLPGLFDARIKSRWNEILTEHLDTTDLAKGPEGWKYKQRLIDSFKLTGFWSSLPETIPVHTGGREIVASLVEVISQPTLALIVAPHKLEFGLPDESEVFLDPDWNEETWAVFGNELSKLSSNHRAELFKGRSITAFRWLPTGHFLAYLEVKVSAKGDQESSYRSTDFVKLPNPYTLGFQVHPNLNRMLYNTSNPLIQWLLRVKAASSEVLHRLTPKHYARVEHLLREACSEYWDFDDTNRYLKKWRDMKDLPPDLYPPEGELHLDMCVRVPNPGG